MTDDHDARKRSWVMTAWSSLCAVLILGLLFFCIHETRHARAGVHEPSYAVDRNGERMLY